MRRFVLCLTLCHFVLVFFSPFSTAITSLGEEKANLSAFRTFVRFVFVWICRFPLPLGVWEGLRFVIVALPGLFSYLFFLYTPLPEAGGGGGGGGRAGGMIIAVTTRNAFCNIIFEP